MTKDYVDTTSITHISLCTGYGGIDLGLARVVSNLRTIAYCEREAAPIELLLSRMEGGQLDAAPIWTDLRTFPWAAFSGKVGILSGGYPCQPFSAAGKRLGAEDERHLWPAIADGIRILRPRICFFENVEGHITLGLSTVISDLEELGYKVSWGIFSASECLDASGRTAPHQRKRVFILAHRSGEGLQRYIARLFVSSGREMSSGSTASCGQSGRSRELADSDSTGSGEDWQSSEPRATGSEQSPCTQGRSDEGEAGKEQVWPSRPGEPQYWWEPPRVVANTEFIGRRGRSDGDARGLCGEIQTARPCGGSAEPAMGDTDCGRQSSGINAGSGGSADCRGEGDIEQAKPREAESKVGGDIARTPNWLGYGELCVSSDNRTDELRMLGNGVCVPTAAKAFVTLMEELL